ncbi:MAG: glycosyltransferase [Nitrospira sp.]
MIRSCQVIASINLDTGGPAVSVSRLAQELAASGCDSHLLTLDYSKLGPQSHPRGTTIHSVHAGWWTRTLRGRNAQVYSILQQLSSDLDIIHNHGLWMYPNWYARSVAKKSGVPLVISPRGMLDDWAMHRRRLRKHLAWQIFERESLQIAKLIHATSFPEAEGVRKLGFSQPIAVIPNGVDLPNLDDIPGRSHVVSQFPHLQHKKWLFFLSRIHPKKGLQELVRSWAKLHSDFPEWHLIISGPDSEGYRSDIEAVCSHLGLRESVTFTGPVSGDLKSALLAGSEVMVLPTHSENFGIVIAESLAHGVPVITTYAAPWKELETERCGWWIEDAQEALGITLKQAMETLPQTRREMGIRGRELVQRRYSWKTVGQQMYDTYKWLLGKDSQSRPNCVI